MRPINLVKEFVKKLNDSNNKKEFSFDIHAQEAFDQSQEVFPRVIVRQTANRPRTMVTDDEPERMEATTTIGYQIEVYARSKKDHSGKLFDRTDVASILVDELQMWFWVNYGLPRNSWSMDSSTDNQTIRAVFRVNGVIDRYEFIYRN